MTPARAFDEIAIPAWRRRDAAEDIARAEWEASIKEAERTHEDRIAAAATQGERDAANRELEEASNRAFEALSQALVRAALHYNDTVAEARSVFEAASADEPGGHQK